MNSNTYIQKGKKGRGVLLIFAMLISTLLFGQVPDAINYQAAVRDISGSIHQNRPVDLRFSIHSGTIAPFTKIYEETHSTTTNSFGLVNLQIGTGTVISGTFSTIDWGSDLHHLQVEIDTGGGYEDMGLMQLVSVPYALSAKKVTDLKLADIDGMPSGPPATGQIVQYNGTTWVFDSIQDSDSQTLSLTGQVLSISNGNSVNLPPAKTYYSGDGISIQNDTVINSAKDQVVTLTGNGATNISGTYPNFVVSSTDSTRAFYPGDGLTLVNDTFHATFGSTMWNAAWIQGKPVSINPPLDGNLLRWNANFGEWEPIPFNEGQWMENNSGDIYYNTGRVGVGTSTPQSQIHVTGDNNAVKIEGTNSPNNHGGKISFGDSTYVTIEEYEDNKLKTNAQHIVLQSDSNSYVNSFGDALASINKVGTGEGELNMYGPNGTKNVSLTGNLADANNGIVLVYDSLGNEGAFMTTSVNRGGYFEIRGPNGKDNVVMGSALSNFNNGYIAVRDTNQWSRATMEVESGGNGYLSTRGGNGNFNFQLGTMANTNEPRFTMHDSAGVVKVESFVHTSQTGILGTYGPNGHRNVRMTSTTVTPDNGILDISNENGLSDLTLRSLQGTGGIMFTYGSNGNANVGISSLSGNTNNGYVSVYDSLGYERQASLVLASGEGYVSTRGPIGARNTAMTTLLGYPNHGFVAADDASGNTQAGIYVDANGDGVVFSDIKNFRMPHPTEDGKEIWYASLEGSEAGAYQRGTATLVNGEVEVTFPEHYKIVANTKTMTVILTPLDASSKGMAVVEKTENGFKVKELAGGSGNYSFDWEVKCVRNGYEEFKVIRDVEDCETARAQDAAQLNSTIISE